jgi:small subunit ribosomal protein S6
MKKYEAMFIIKPDLKEEDKNAVLKGIKDQVVKHQGAVTQDQVWAERRKLAYDLFPISGGTRYKEGLYYLINFEADPLVVNALKGIYSLNESILRYMILRLDEKRVA